MFPQYDKVRVGVITESKDEEMYFNLFNLLLKGNIVRLKNIPMNRFMETEDAHVKFIPKLQSSRGNKFHYVINLTQDKDFHEQVALPMTVIHDYLKQDQKWRQLF